MAQQKQRLNEIADGFQRATFAKQFQKNEFIFSNNEATKELTFTVHTLRGENGLANGSVSMIILMKRH